MEITQAQRILLDTMNEAARELGGPTLSDQDFLKLPAETKPYTSAFLKAMDLYARAKWKQAYQETWEAVNLAMGDQPVEESIALCNVPCPEFKP